MTDKLVIEGDLEADYGCWEPDNIRVMVDGKPQYLDGLIREWATGEDGNADYKVPGIRITVEKVAKVAK